MWVFSNTFLWIWKLWNVCYCVSLDSFNAFESVNPKILLDNELNSHGIWGIPHQWLTSYLSDRSEIVNISHKFWDSIKLSYGAPHGAKLSPVLFLMYVNEIRSSQQHGKLFQYAAYTTLCLRSKSKSFLEPKLKIWTT